MTEFLFSYGTLQKPDVQMKLFGRSLDGLPDTLVGYKTFTIEIRDEAFLVGGYGRYQLTLVHTGNENDRVNGMALELTDQEIAAADQYEPVNYRRVKVALASGSQAWLYVTDETSRS